MKFRARLLNLVGGFSKSQAGVAAIEFAMTIPFLLFLFVGMVELITAISYDRRVSKTGSSIADLVARSSDVTGKMDDIERAIAHQMTPYDDADIDVRIGMVLIKANSPEIVWSWGNKVPVPWAKGSKPDGVSFSANMKSNGQYYLISTSSLDYNFILGKLLSNLSQVLTGESDQFTSIALSDSFVLHPRKVSCVEYYNSCANYPS
ncbi:MULTISPECIES: TadE/TadG family type IV pilus assembly protein [unclassified Pseudovibrio]|uniref:TadE/TadG family type IV pilus assembly protein n=1 Tax=unclassified Pseudovibrio TaxID=2627060 RepID=UPI0007AE3992|nr:MULTISPECIES: TadE/TadG family type IV pilus assembly protein [unclassified Pseudovibrio]KZL24317.1 hypothetical protein PsWM33_02647 [Pseudovibrio sp. WM33]KZL28216.1 hypothetical protein PsAD37_00993 [Pseudovibrio sp. Ad37]